MIVIVKFCAKVVHSSPHLLFFREPKKKKKHSQDLFDPFQALLWHILIMISDLALLCEIVREGAGYFEVLGENLSPRTFNHLNRVA